MARSKSSRYVWYAVAKGRNGSGIYSTWNEAEKQTNKVSKVKYKGCDTIAELEKFFSDNNVDFKTVHWAEGTKLDLPADGSSSIRDVAHSQPAEHVPALCTTFSFPISAPSTLAAPTVSVRMSPNRAHAAASAGLSSALAAASALVTQVAAACGRGPCSPASTAAASRTPVPSPQRSPKPAASGRSANVSAEAVPRLVRMRDTIDAALSTGDTNVVEGHRGAASAIVLPQEEIIELFRHLHEETASALVALGKRKAPL